MKFPKNTVLKIYFVIYGWLCFSDLGALLTPDNDAFIYYHALKAFYPPAGIYYSLAVVRIFVNLACLIPLFNYIFEKNQPWKWFLKPLLVIRIIADVMGHNYEWQAVKSLFYINQFLPLAAIGVWAGVSFLSYKVHFICAFSRSHAPASAPERPKG